MNRIQTWISAKIWNYFDKKYFQPFTKDHKSIKNNFHHMTNSRKEGAAFRFYPFSYDDATAWPWWKLFHVTLNLWYEVDTDERHRHDRWSISLVLVGEAIEDRYAVARYLSPGSFVFRSSTCEHRFFPLNEGTTLTLYIYGRRQKQFSKQFQ